MFGVCSGLLGEEMIPYTLSMRRFSSVSVTGKERVGLRSPIPLSYIICSCCSWVLELGWDLGTQ